MPYASINPATGETIAEYPETSPSDLDRLLGQAAADALSWRSSDFATRARCLKAAAKNLRANQERFAVLMAREMGKPMTQGRAEIEKCAWCCEYYAEHAEEFLKPQPAATDAAKSFVSFQALGVVLGIMPWNFPFWQVIRFAAPTLSAGNGIVLKHASNVFGCAREIEKIFRESGFPEHLFRTVIAGSEAVPRLIGDSRIAAVSITSSVGAGKAVATEAGKVLKKCVLELGGSDPFIVLEDADLEKAAEVGVQARFQNTGQSCIAAKRFILHHNIQEEFIRRFVEKTRQLKMGDPLEAETQVGPMAKRELRDELRKQLQKSLELGADLLCGGKIQEGPGAYFPPTVIAGVKAGMPAYSEELFGPVATIITVADETEAVRVANATQFGLGASIWTGNAARGEKLAEHFVEAGSCFVNAMVKSDPRLPFGGIKHSGYGRELGHFGIHEFVNIKSVLIAK